jgi:hypothetical protein
MTGSQDCMQDLPLYCSGIRARCPAISNHYTIALIAVILLSADLVLVFDYGYTADDGPPLPNNDFSRLTGLLSAPKVSQPGYSIHHHISKEEEARHVAKKKPECACNPMLSPSTIIKCSLSSTGAQQLRIANGERVSIKFMWL